MWEVRRDADMASDALSTTIRATQPGALAWCIAQKNVAMHKTVRYMGLIQRGGRRDAREGKQRKDFTMTTAKTTKTDAKTETKFEAPKADVFAFPSFDANEVTDMYRQYADQTTRQAREAYGRMKDTFEDAQSTMENTFENVQNAGVSLGLKAIDAMRTNAELGLSHLESMLKVKSASEFVELQTGYVRKQTETAVDQAKAMQELSTKAVADVSAPVKEQVEKATRELKAA